MGRIDGDENRRHVLGHRPQRVHHDRQFFEGEGAIIRTLAIAEIGSSTSQVEWKTSSMALMGAPSR